MTPQEQVQFARYKEAVVRSDDTIAALERGQAQQEQRLKALQAEIERLAIDNHILRQEVERLTLRLKPGQETLR